MATKSRRCGSIRCALLSGACGDARRMAVVALLLCAGVCVHAHTSTEEPDAFLDYIEATGSQYIDTGVNAETGLKARIDFAWASEDISGKDWSLLDAAIDSTASDKRNRFLMCHLYGGGGKPYFGYGVKQRKNPDGSFPFVGGQRYEIVTDMSDPDSLQLVQNGKNTFSATDLETFKTNGVVNLNLSLYVFACNSSNIAKWFSEGRLYELKIWKKNAASGEFDLLRHYLPCIKGGRAGLYDKVEGKIYYSSSDSNFVAGPVLDKPLDFVEWISTDGNQWFDTHVWGKGGLKSEVDVGVRDYAGEHCILGTRRGDNRYFPAYNYESLFRYAYGSMPAKDDTTAVVPAEGVRYRIQSDLCDGYQSVTVSADGGVPVELHKDTVYLTGENVVTNTLALMACHQDDSYTHPSRGLVHRATIWDGDELLRDFVPVVATNSAGVAYAGLYETVTERIYRQIGTAEFDLATQVGAITNSLREVTYPAYLEGADDQMKAKYDAWAKAYGPDTAGEYAAAFLLNVAPTSTPVVLRIVGIEVVEGDAQVRVAATAGGSGIDLSRANGVIYVAAGDTVTNLVEKTVPGATFSGDGQTATVTVPSAAGAFIKAVIDSAAPDLKRPEAY